MSGSMEHMEHNGEFDDAMASLELYVDESADRRKQNLVVAGYVIPNASSSKRSMVVDSDGRP